VVNSKDLLPKPLRQERLFYFYIMRKILASLLASVLLFSCSSAPELVQVTNQGPAQGSTYSISYLVLQGVDYRSEIDSILKAMDQQMSLWVSDSEISRLNNGDSIRLNTAFARVITLSKLYSELTSGQFDITIAPVIKAWGFSGGTYNENVNVDSLLQYVGAAKLPLPEVDSLYALPFGFQVDVNAIAQGYTVDVIADFLESKGTDNYMVEVGGEVRCKGENVKGRGWRIGIEKPVEDRIPGQFQTIIALDSMSLATSGNYRKFWVSETGQKVVHTIDPKTGQPVISNILSASIIASNATLADALATACMVAGPNAMQLVAHFSDAEAYFIVGNKKGELEVQKTEGWSAYEPN
jgi:thiamine biosynthesis lipoprotein